jgi:hypothetical protein
VQICFYFILIFYASYLTSVKDVAMNKAEMYSRDCYSIYVMFTVSFQHYWKLLLKEALHVTHICVCANVGLCMYVCVYVRMYACINVCMYVCMHVCTYVCMYVVRMYVCMQATNKYMHAFT